jgi:putative transposase
LCFLYEKDFFYSLCSRSYRAYLELLKYIKGKSGRKLLQEFDLLRKRYWGQHLWARGYFVVSVGNVNANEVQKYIEDQEAHHKKDDFKISEF